MVRILLVVIAAAAIGSVGGFYDAGGATSGYSERFSSSREAMAERRGEATREELLAAATGTPQIEVVGGTTFNFGTMQHGETREHEFLVRNIGDGPLNLEMGPTTCKCTIGDLTESVLMPGEETAVKLSWTAQSLIRQFGQTAKIITTDPKATEVKLTVQGQVVDSFVLEPQELGFSDFLGSDGTEKTFYVINYFDKSTDLEDLHWTNKKTARLIEISHEKMDLDKELFPQHSDGKEMFKVNVKIKPGMPLGRLKGRLQFSTALGDAIGMIDVPVSGQATGDVSLFGGSSFDSMLSMVSFGTVRASEGSQITVFMRVSEELVSRGKPEIVSVSPESSLRASIGEPKKAGARQVFPIRLEVPKHAEPVSLVGPKADKYGQVVIRTEGEAGGEITIYCRMIVVN